jgi:hypothetical protein
VMDRCLTEQPPLAPVDGEHRSSCWLPAEAIGLSAQAEKARETAVGTGRTGREASAVAQRIAAAADAKGGIAP